MNEPEIIIKTHPEGKEVMYIRKDVVDEEYNDALREGHNHGYQDAIKFLNNFCFGKKITIVDILRKFLVGKTIRLTRTYNNNNKKPFKVKSVEPQHEFDWFGYKVFISGNKFIDDLEIDEEFFILDDN